MSTPSSKSFFGPSPITRPLFAFGILQLSAFALQIVTAVMFIVWEPYVRVSKGLNALLWIAAFLYLVPGLFACILASKNKNSNFNVKGSIALAILSAASLFVAGGVFVPFTDALSVLNAMDSAYAGAVMAMSTAVASVVYSIVLIGLSVAHASISIKHMM